MRTAGITNHWSEGGIGDFHDARLAYIGKTFRLAQFTRSAVSLKLSDLHSSQVMESQTDNPNSPYDRVEELEMTGALFDEQKLRTFTCACCRLIWDKLPKIAQNALVVAEDYNRSLVSREELTVERVKLWQSCDAIRDRDKNSISEMNALRAVICCLGENISKHEAFDAATYTMDFCNYVEPKKQEQYSLLQTIFTP